MPGEFIRDAYEEHKARRRPMLLLENTLPILRDLCEKNRSAWKAEIAPRSLLFFDTSAILRQHPLRICKNFKKFMTPGVLTVFFGTR
jgi:hypothetical protein